MLYRQRLSCPEDHEGWGPGEGDEKWPTAGATNML